MSTEGRLSSEEALELLRSAKRSIFRLETLDRYNVSEDDEDYRRWSRGEPPPPIDGHRWFDDVVRVETSAGKRWERVHMVRLPLTDYLRFECEYGYTRLEQAGERVHVLEVPEGEPLPLSPVDFWLFDDTLVLRVDYDAEGRDLGFVPMTDMAVVGEFRQTRDVALSLATPFPAWFRQAQGAGHI